MSATYVFEPAGTCPSCRLPRTNEFAELYSHQSGNTPLRRNLVRVRCEGHCTADMIEAAEAANQ